MRITLPLFFALATFSLDAAEQSGVNSGSTTVATQGIGGLLYCRYRPPGKPTTIECDVAVDGGTSAGVTAAIHAARMGRKTVLLSFNRHVGRMTSGGLTATGIGDKNSIGGLAQEFYGRINRIADFRPSEAESLMLKMVDEAGVTPIESK